ncbi:MAG: hypothetical protein ACON38_10695 [Akkermansiaceae bacterium]
MTPLTCLSVLAFHGALEKDGQEIPVTSEKPIAVEEAREKTVYLSVDGMC